jgi:mRNA interferase RelE/StbE
MRYTVHIDRKAAKEMKALDTTTVRRLRERINEIADNPFDLRLSGPITMGTGERKARVGDWRIIFEVDETTKTIIILAVKPRRRAYPKQ